MDKIMFIFDVNNPTSNGVKKTAIYFCVAASFFVMVGLAHAQSYTPLAPLPGTTVGAVGAETTNLSLYLSGMIKLLIALGGAFSILMAIIGGTQYVAAGVSPDAKSGAKERIQNALVGLALVLTSYLILNSISPNLVKFNFMLPPIGVSVPAVGGGAGPDTAGGAPASVATPQTLSGGGTNTAVHASVPATSVTVATVVTAPTAQSTVIPDTSTAGAGFGAVVQNTFNTFINRDNDHSIITHCIGNSTEPLCNGTDLNHNGGTDDADVVLFVQRTLPLDVNGDKIIELANLPAPISCFFKKSTASIPAALARQGVLLDASGHIVEQATGEGISLGLFSGAGAFSLSRVGHVATGSAVGYRDPSVVATSTAPLPTATISVLPVSLFGNAASISWSSTGATMCSASGGWSGVVGVSGSTGGTLSRTQATSYYLTCQGEGGIVNASATINLSSTNLWVSASELNSVCASTNGLSGMPFSSTFTNDQFSKFQDLLTISGPGNRVSLNTFFSKLFWVVTGFGEQVQATFVETPLAIVSYATVAQYDLNNDGTADFNSGGADMSAFNACKNGAVSGACAQADFNGDGTIDDYDIMIGGTTLHPYIGSFVDLVRNNLFSGPQAIPGFKLADFESNFFDINRYSDKQIIKYCDGHRPWFSCGAADVNNDHAVNSTDLSVFDTGAPLLNFNGDGKVDLVE